MGHSISAKFGLKRGRTLAGSAAITIVAAGTLTSELAVGMTGAANFNISAAAALTSLTAPVWSVTPAPVFTAGRQSAYLLGVSGATSVTFAPGSTTATWLTLRNAGAGAFELVADGTQADANDLTGVRLRASNAAGSSDSAVFGVTVNLSTGESPASGSASWVSLYDLSQNFTATNNLNSAGAMGQYGDIGVWQYSTAHDTYPANAATKDGWALTYDNVTSGAVQFWSLITPIAGTYERTMYDPMTGADHFKIPG